MFIDLLDPATIRSLLLKEWNISDVFCKRLEYQCFPEFFSPSEIPDEYMNGKKESDLPTSFFAEYFRLLNFHADSLDETIVLNGLRYHWDKKICSKPNNRLR